FEVVERLRQTEDLVGDIAQVPPEGSLAPDTYSFSRGATRESVLAQMLSAQEEILANAWANRADDLPIDSPEDLLVLASIIEREAGGAEEWAKVASVFVNRLNKGMRLEADATVRYGITLGERKLRRGLLRSVLDRVTPYNTYKIDGLPPTPIANPGRLAIEATAQPDTTEYIFFVADGTGGHAFSVTYEEHNRNVREWRRIEAERRAAQEN
ncbi:MAG: endolytic transglycosylase MltG, partial [Pseudomonadota bacterium]